MPPSTRLSRGSVLLLLGMAAACENSTEPERTTTPRLSVSPIPPATLVGAGDIASCTTTRDNQTGQLLDAIDGTVFTAGDNAYPNGTLADYTNCYDPAWGKQKWRTYAALGNHEYDTGNADATWDYFGDRAGPRGKGFYSYDLGAWHIIVLNDNTSYVPFGAGTEQYTWLDADLAANTSDCTLAIWHQPRFYSNPTAGGATETTSRKKFWDRLYLAGVDVIVNGHKHHYERFAPMDNSGALDPSSGIREFIVGTGGASSNTPVVIAPNSEIRGTPAGVMKFTLRDGGYDWQLIPIAGETFTDSGSDTCRNTHGLGTSTTYLVDTFSRTVSGGWGIPDTGEAWTSTSTSHSVDGSRGLIRFTTATNLGSRSDIGQRDVVGVLSVAIDVLPGTSGGDSHSIQLYARRIDGSNQYRAVLKFKRKGSITADLRKYLAGKSTVLKGPVTLKPTFAAGTRYKMRFQVSGTSPAVVLRFRLWQDGQVEPSTWDLETTVSEPALDRAGGWYVRAEPFSGQVAFPVVFSFDDMTVSAP